MTKSHAMVNIGRHLRSQMDVCMMFVTLGGGLLPPTPPCFPKPFYSRACPEHGVTKMTTGPNRVDSVPPVDLCRLADTSGVPGLLHR